MADINTYTLFFENLRAQPVLVLFLVLGMGYLLGNIRIASFSFGPVAGVLFAGLFLGNFNFRISPEAQEVGFALYIFSVGYQAGPRFFDVLKVDGLKFFLLAFIVAVSGFSMAVIAEQFLLLPPGMSGGLLAGGLTSSPTLAAAQEAIRSGQVKPSGGLTAEAMIDNVATAYAITYLFGLIGFITIMKLLPQVLGVHLEKEAKLLENKDPSHTVLKPANISARIYRVTSEEVTQIPFKQLRDKYWDKTSVVKIKKDGEVFKPLEPEGSLQLGDELLILAPVEYFTSTISKFGEEVTPKANTAQRTETALIVVLNNKAVGKSLQKINIPEKFGVLLTRVTRMRMEVPLTADFTLRKGDILTVVGAHDNVNLLGDELGHVERENAETDMLTFSFGVVIGVVIGLFSVSIGKLSIGLGSAGGLLTSGLFIGYMRSIHPTFGRLPSAARWILMEFGLLLFMAGVGLQAGDDILETLTKTGPILFLAGIVVTVTPIFTAYLFGRKVLKINPVLLLGGIAGSMTSGAALNVIKNASKSSMPSLGYVGSYAFANVLLTIAGSIILFL